MNNQGISKRLLSIRDVCAMTSLSRTSIFLKAKAGDFAKPVKLGQDGIRKAFLASEVEAWVDALVAERDAA